MSRCNIIAITTQRRRRATTTVNLGVGLVQMGKRVLLVDAVRKAALQQASAQRIRTSCGIYTTVMQSIRTGDSELRYHSSQRGCRPATVNIELSGLEVSLINTMSREFVLRIVYTVGLRC